MLSFQELYNSLKIIEIRARVISVAAEGTF